MLSSHEQGPSLRAGRLQRPFAQERTLMSAGLVDQPGAVSWIYQ